MGNWSWFTGAVAGVCTATSLCAGAVSLFEPAPRAALIQPAASPPEGRAQAAAPASLFVGRAGASLFAQPAPRVLHSDHRGMTSDAARVIRKIIEQAESRRDGYDAVQHGARIKPPRKPTQMTVAEIYKWIDETPGQPHAIGPLATLYSGTTGPIGRRIAGRGGVPQSQGRPDEPTRVYEQSGENLGGVAQ